MENNINEDQLPEDLDLLAANSPEVTKKINEKLAELESYKAKLIDRANQINIIHESVVVVEKIDLYSLKTWLSLPEENRFDRIRMSFYGRVLKVSNINSGDPVQEEKKKQIAVGDIISFNPDSAYSLNITIPEKLSEIWVIAVDNVLMIDKAIDYDFAKEKSVRDSVVMDYIEARRRAANFMDQHKKLTKPQSPNKGAFGNNIVKLK